MSKGERAGVHSTDISRVDQAWLSAHSLCHEKRKGKFRFLLKVP